MGNSFELRGFLSSVLGGSYFCNLFILIKEIPGLKWDDGGFI